MIKKFTQSLCAGAFLLLLTMFSFAQNSPYGTTANPYPFGPTETGPVLYDQMWNSGSGYLNSSEYTDAANITKTSETADDFDVPAGGSWTIGKLAFAGYYGYNHPGGATNVNVRIYDNDNGMPGTELHSFINVTPSYAEEAMTGSYMATYTEVEISPAITLTEGKYWISVQYIVDFNMNGDWGWADAENNPWIGEKLHWRNPQNGWGLGYTTWTPGDIVMFFGYFDRAFALFEPSLDNDLAARLLVAPASAPGLTASETITMQLKNEGALAQSGFSLAYIINGGTPVIENTGSLNINPEEVLDHSFGTSADFSASGIYDIQLITMLGGDQYMDNDTVDGQVVNYGTVYVMQDGVDITSCEGTFTDPGGLYNNFNQNDVATVTIYPGTAGDMVRLNFIAFDVTWSDFYIYDGPTTNDPLLGYWQDDDSPGVVTALNPTGALTIYFEAPGWDDAFGWEAIISCYDQPDDDFAITDFSKSTALVYTNLEFEFSARVRNIGAVAQSKDVSFYVDGTLIGSVNTGMVNPTEYATVTLAHTMSYDGAVNAEVTIPADGGDDPANNQAELDFDVYLIDTFVEFFEQETFPPDYWSVPENSGWMWQTASGFPYEGIGSAQVYVPWGGTDTLVSPQLIIEYGDFLSIMLKTSLWWPGKMKIMWRDANTGIWSEIETINPSMHYENYMIDISAAAGMNYIGFIAICDDPFAWGGELTMDNVIGLDPMLYFVDEDLKAFNLQGTATPAVNMPTTYTVEVQNVGNNTVQYNTYSVKLMQKDPSGDIELTSAIGLTTTHLQKRTYDLTHTFQASGEYDVYALVDYGPDMITENDTSNGHHLYVQVSGTIEVEIGTPDDKSPWIPMRSGSYYSISQSIYPESMIGQTGALTGMTYYYTNNNYGAVTGIPVMVYVGTTTNSYLSAYIDPDDLTLVYNDTVDFALGSHELYLPYSVPINYDGGNLIAYVYKGHPGSWQNTVEFDVSYVSDTLSGWSTSFYYINPEKPDSATSCNKELEIPLTTFFVNTAGFGEITGTVYDENGDPFPGVDVGIDGTTVSSVTNQDGEYFINEILGGAQSLTASVFEYEDNTQPTSIQAGIVNYLDFTMVPKPRVDISGTVVGNDDPQNFLENAYVELNGYFNFFTFTDENGEFVLPWVYGNETYSLTISLNGYETYYNNSIQVLDGNIDLGVIELLELMSIPYCVYAHKGESEISLNWSVPNTGTAEHYTYDITGNNGYANEPNEHVWLGNIYETEDRGTITSVSLFFWDYMTNSGEVSLDILNAAGEVVMTSEPFMTVNNDWVHVDIPDVYFDGTFFAMVHWENNPETTDFLDSYDTDFGQHGPNHGYIMYEGAPPYHVSEVVGKDVTFIIEVDALIEDETRGGGRAIEGYNVYTGLLDDALNASSWTPLNSSPVSDTFFVDAGWPPSTTDDYIYAVEAVYTTGHSIFSFSNPVNIDTIVSVSELPANWATKKLYPNPATNTLFVECNQAGTAKIFSVTGQQMNEYRLEEGLNLINISAFEKGVYFIRIVDNNNETNTLKFIKR